MRFAVMLALLVGIGSAVGETTPDSAPLHFDHARHKARGVEIDTACLTCHATDAKGTIMPPAATGHSPCLNGVCHALPLDKKDFTHATWFVASGPTGKARNPAVHATATRFCQGCHGGTEAPSPASKPATAAVLAAFESQREFHVEMPGAVGHFFHTKEKIKDKQVQCTHCHAKGGKTAVSPGHPECAGCHGDPAREITHMNECGSCHRAGGRQVAYPTDSRKHNDVRQCGSEGHRQWAKRMDRPLDKTSCFTHDREGHQFYEQGVATDKAKRVFDHARPVECKACHQLVVDKQLDLAALHTEEIIVRQQTPAHALCGSCHEHKDQVVGSEDDCVKCHPSHQPKGFH